MHRRAHEILALRHDPDYPLPDLRSVSFLRPGHWTQRTDLHPPSSLIDAIDRRAGCADWQLRRDQRLTEFREAMVGALTALQEYDEKLYRTVDRVCVHGSVTLLPGEGIRHEGEQVEQAAHLYYAGDMRRLQEGLTQAWELLGILLAGSETLTQGLEQQAVNLRMLDWLRERGLSN